MKKINLKLSLLAICAMVTLGAITTSCSKDKDGTEQLAKGNVDAMVGSYKGKVTVFQELPGSGAKRDFFDAIITVSKVGNDKVKLTAKSGEAYSSITEKTMNVMLIPGSKNVMAATGDVNGTFIFNAEIKSLTALTQKQAESDVMFAFEGVKQ